MSDNNLLNMDDLADIFAQLNDIEEAPKAQSDEEPSPEELASQRRYEEIIKKHKHDNNQ